MKSYLDLLKQVRLMGSRQKNRTGIDTIMIPGGMIQHDLAEGFPLLTTKKMALKPIAAELAGFISGTDSAKKFREMGTKIWDANANNNEAWLKNPNRKGDDDLGRIYGKQWREWYGVNFHLDRLEVRCVDQFRWAVEQIINNPTSRRIVINSWQPAELDQMALPPCHYAYQFLVEQGRHALHLCMTMRSCDMFLGVPFNIASYALLLSLVAKATGLEPGRLTIFLADVHIYLNHIQQVDEQLRRKPYPLPSLHILKEVDPGELHDPVIWLERFRPDDVTLIDYEFHPPLRGEMAV